MSDIKYIVNEEKLISLIEDKLKESSELTRILKAIRTFDSEQMEIFNEALKNVAKNKRKNI